MLSKSTLVSRAAIGAALLCIPLAISHAASADDKAKPAAASAPAASPEMPMATPGKHHELLKQFAGNWNAVVKETTPDGKTRESKGTCTNTLIFGGRYVQMSFKVEPQGGQPAYEGGGVMGYSNADKRFESTWYDTMSTGITMMTGSFDETGKVVTLSGDSINPMTGEKMKMRDVTRIVDKDTHTQEMSIDVGEGKFMTIMSITYTRAKP